jgi:hypothetical protein
MHEEGGRMQRNGMECVSKVCCCCLVGFLVVRRSFEGVVS